VPLPINSNPDAIRQDGVDHGRQAIVAEAEWDWGGIDVLINNAGVSYRAVVEHVDDRERLSQMDVNFRSPMELIRLLLPGMRAKRSGRIISVSSVGGMMAMPTMAAYSASKFALNPCLSRTGGAQNDASKKAPAARAGDFGRAGLRAAPTHLAS
jgi:NAD(P)-dependent dehydrogenase (short-subunit alcohol dehydrogenase family)